MADMRRDPGESALPARLTMLWRSFAAKLILLLIVFVAVPVVIFLQFRNADLEKNTLLLRAAQEQGSLIARALTSLLVDFDGKSVKPLSKMVEELAAGRSNVKLLFRPKAAQRLDNFYYVASAPALSTDYLEEERQELIRQGIFDRIDNSCNGNLPQTYRYTNPAGREELVTSILPINVKSGCWIVITSQAASEYLSSSLGRPYWDTPVVKAAVAIYLFMALVMISLVLDIGRNLRRFGRLARQMRLGYSDDASFAKHNRIPELHHVAQEFDGLISSLRSSKLMIRQAAEENAHALKAPLGVICQAIEPLRRSVPQQDERGHRSIQLIEQSVRRLDALVSALRQMDVVMAESIRPPRRQVDLSRFVGEIVDAFSENWSVGGPTLRCEIETGIWVDANEDLIETALENIFENSRSFSPVNASVVVRLIRSGKDAVLSVEDRGPGVPDENLDRIFVRYFTARSDNERDVPAPSGESENHSGIGLWVVRRNFEAFGGTVQAENIPGAGLRIIVKLPLAR